MHPFSGTWPWLECLRVTIRVVGANIRNQDLVGLWIFHISTTHFKERNRSSDDYYSLAPLNRPVYYL